VRSRSEEAAVGEDGDTEGAGVMRYGDREGMETQDAAEMEL
jgi:hypothetical protein